MSEVVIFCESYPQIKNALYLATQNYRSSPVTVVIPGMHDLYKFFKLANEKVFNDTLNILYLDVYRGRIAGADNKIKKALYVWSEIVKEKRHLAGIFNKHFAQLTGAEIFFFSRWYNPSTFYLLKTLDKTHRLVYMPEPSYDVLSMEKVSPANINEALYLFWCKLVYGYDISLGKHPLGQKTTRMPDSFFRENVARIYNQEERDNMLEGFDISKFRVLDNTDYSVMYFHEDLVEHNYIADSEAFKRELIEVFNIMGKHFPENKVALKYHPGSGEDRTAMPFGEVLPDFIPAELLYNEKVKMYLGISSMALANVEKGLAVSLIDLVSFKNDTIREQLKEILVQWSRSEILFPQSLDEFEGILIDINKKTPRLKEVK